MKPNKRLLRMLHCWARTVCESDNCENRVLGWWTFPSWQIAYASRWAVGLGRSSAPHPGGTAFREASASCERPATRVRPANCLLEWPAAPGAQWTVTIRNRPAAGGGVFSSEADAVLSAAAIHTRQWLAAKSGGRLTAQLYWDDCRPVHFLETVVIMTSSLVIAVTWWIQILDSPTPNPKAVSESGKMKDQW